jgi:hypothetical protein
MSKPKEILYQSKNGSSIERFFSKEDVMSEYGKVAPNWEKLPIEKYASYGGIFVIVQEGVNWSLILRDDVDSNIFDKDGESVSKIPIIDTGEEFRQIYFQITSNYGFFYRDLVKFFETGNPKNIEDNYQVVQVDVVESGGKYGNSLVVMEYNLDQLFEIVDIDNDGAYFVKVIMNPYETYDFSADNAEMENFFQDGLWVGYFSEENKKKWQLINELLYPYDVDAYLHPDFKGIQIPETIHSIFRNEVEDIVYSLAGYDNDIREAGAEQFIRDSFKEYFESFGFEYSFESDLLTTKASNLLLRSLRLNKPYLNLRDTLEEIFKRKSLEEYYFYEEIYDYYPRNENMPDSTRMNNFVGKKMDLIINQIKNSHLKDGIEIQNKLKKLVKEKGKKFTEGERKFIVSRLDEKNNNVIVVTSSQLFSIPFEELVTKLTNYNLGF